VALAFTSWSFDAASYAPGAPVTLTVQYTSDDVADASAVATAVTATLSDGASPDVSQTSDDSGNFPSFTTSTPGNTPRPVTVIASPGVWTVVSNAFADGGPPFLGTAVLTSVA
jgi:hypothetical protein